MSNQSQGIYDARSLGRSKFTSLIGLIPAVTIGGVSLILYSMISAVGVRNLVETSVDFSSSRKEKPKNKE
jgi:hypothetical protein